MSMTSTTTPTAADRRTDPRVGAGPRPERIRHFAALAEAEKTELPDESILACARLLAPILPPAT